MIVFSTGPRTDEMLSRRLVHPQPQLPGFAGQLPGEHHRLGRQARRGNGWHRRFGVAKGQSDDMGAASRLLAGLTWRHLGWLRKKIVHASTFAATGAVKALSPQPSGRVGYIGIVGCEW